MSEFRTIENQVFVSKVSSKRSCEACSTRKGVRRFVSQTGHATQLHMCVDCVKSSTFVQSFKI